MWDASYDSNRLEQRAGNKPVSVYSPELSGDINILDPRLDHDYVKFKRGNTWAGTFRLGYLMEPSIAIFIKGSLLYSTFYLEQGSVGLSKNSSKKIMGFEPGVGVDINLQKGLFIRGEYGYQMFKKFTSSNLISVKQYPDEAIICSVSPRYHVVRLGLGYKLNIF